MLKPFLHKSISGQLVETQGRLHERFLTHKILVEPALTGRTARYTFYSFSHYHKLRDLIKDIAQKQ